MTERKKTPRSSVLASALAKKPENDFKDGAIWALETIKSVIFSRRDSINRVKDEADRELYLLLGAVESILNKLWVDASATVAQRLLTTLDARRQADADKTPR